MFPLLLRLLNLYDMCEKSALYLGEIQPVANEDFYPEFTVLKGQIYDESSRLGVVFLKLIVQKV